MSRGLLAAIYQATVGTSGVRYRQEPTGAAGVVVADDAAWDQIIAASTITVEHWLTVLNIGFPAAGITADTEEVVAEGSGGADGAAVAAATLLVEQELLATIDTAVGEYPAPLSYLPVPIQCPANIRHAGRISSSATGGMAISLGIGYISGLGGS